MLLEKTEERLVRNRKRAVLCQYLLCCQARPLAPIAGFRDFIVI